MTSTAGVSSSGGIDDNVVGNAGEHVGDGSVRLKKGPWTAEEDAILMEYVRKHGEGNWNAVQRNSGLVRCGKSCRLRWANHLRPNLKKGAFTPQEERLIIELHAKFGNKWARMAALLPGRTDNEIKNYWNTRIKRHQRQGIPLYPPDIQPQNQNQNQTSLQSFHPQYNQHFHSLPPTPTTPTSSFTFQTQQLASPTGSVPPYMNSPNYQQHSPNYQQHSPISPHLVASHSFSSHPLYDFSLQNNSGFTFQNQLSSPTTPTNTCGNSPRPPPASPLQSPCANTNVSTLPLFEFPVQRSPPVLQAPLRFKRFSSSTPTTPTATSNHNNQTMSLHNTQFQLPFPPLNSASNSTILRHSSTSPCFPELMRSSSDFHEEIQRENEKMCSLFASVTQSELPSNQLLSQTEFDHSVMTNAVGGSSSFGKSSRRVCMKRNGVDSRDKGNAFMELMRNGFAEELLLDTKELMSREESPFILPEERPNLLDFDTEFKPVAEAADEQNTLTEDLTDFLISIPPSMQAKFYPDSGDISNGQSSVITDDNVGYDMQQMASLIPSTTVDHHDKSLETCTWDNLPGIC